ncbi:glycoprotease (O-sialoglycoprotein endopeptidase) [Legionella pneumophila]|nr:glycoprotease (O-sialoglycoprotein endopeptidase) [Legionella pneumophila]
MIRLAQKANIKAVSVAQAQPVYVRNQVTQEIRVDKNYWKYWFVLYVKENCCLKNRN